MIGEQLREEPRPHSPGHDGGHTNAKNTGSGRRSFFHLMMGSLEMRQSGLQARIKYPSDRRRLYAGGASFEHLLTEIELEIFYGHTDIGLRDTQPLGRSTYTALFVNGTKRSDLPEVYSAHCSAPPQELIATSRDRRHEPRSEEHTSELQSLMRISYAVFCLNKKNK